MSNPDTVEKFEKAFARKHSGRLRENGTLTEATEPAFALLSRTFALLRTLDPDAEQNGWVRYFALLKSFQTYARHFGMSTDKIPKPTKPVENPEETDQFGF